MDVTWNSLHQSCDTGVRVRVCMRASA